MKKYIPYPSVLIIQMITICFLLFAIIPVIIYANDVLKIILLVLFGVLWLVDICILLLSFFKWWNIPIIISNFGLSKMGKKQHLWAEVSSVCIIVKIKSMYGPFRIIEITYRDGSKLSFEHYESICQSIRKYCLDELCLEKFEEVFSQK